MAMNPELKAKWVAALRSGDYEQGAGRLFDPQNNTYCCLGVLTSVQSLEFDSARRDACQYLTDEAAAGLSLFEQRTLAGMNDGLDQETLEKTERKTFPEIADYIEKNL